MKPIYNPKGAAAEYGDYALNIYTGCSHSCTYCYCPQVLHRDRQEFYTHVEPRKNIVEETRKQLEREHITGKLIHLCFSCDPYPTGYDTATTRQIIKLLKESGNNAQILTKGDGSRDFDLLDCNDWYGVTYSGCHAKAEPGAVPPVDRLYTLLYAKSKGIKTWVSFEPVVDAYMVLKRIKWAGEHGVDKIKIGKLHYRPSNINWKQFGEQAEALCKELGIDYYIKESLRQEMGKM